MQRVHRGVAAVGEQEGARAGGRLLGERLLDEQLEVGEGERVAAEGLDRLLGLGLGLELGEG